MLVTMTNMLLPYTIFPILSALLAIPPELNLTAEYPVAIVKAGRHPELARSWIDLVKSPAGGAALREAGFVACPKP